MSLLQRADFNPIIVKELRARMRGGRAFITLTIALLLNGAVSYALYRMTLASAQYSTSPISPQVGQMLFTGLAFLELFIIAAITPSITAGEISGEKEKQTYEMLLTTPLNPASILWGKWIAAMSYIFIVIFAAIPMASLVFIYGGVTLRDMLKALLALLVIAVFFGAIGLFFSAVINRSATATVVSYLVVALVLLAPIFAGMLAGVMNQGDPPRWVLNPSPLMVLASTFQPSVNTSSISSTFWMLGSPIYWILGSAPISQTSIPRPAYHYGLPIYGLLTILLYLVSTRLVLPIRRWKIHWSEMLLGAVILCGYVGIVAIAFLATTNRYENIRIVTPATATPAAVEPLIAPLELQMEATATPEEPVETPAETPTPEALGALFAPHGWTDRVSPFSGDLFQKVFL